jgi:sugar lactone lactonase YvrE
MEYRPALTFGENDFDRTLRGLAVAGDGRAVYAVGDSRVAVFDPDGTLLRRWDTTHPGYSVAVDPQGKVWAGQAGQIEIFDAAGVLVDTWHDDQRLGLVTALGFTAGGVLAADAVARCIRHYDRAGNFRNNIGDRHRKGGFHIPNGVVDFAVDRQGVVHVANPGMHRVERYTADGELVGRFGRFDGVDPEGFGGCCNPTNVAVANDGRVMVTEKAGPRAKVYDPEGHLLAVVAAGEAFDPAAKNMDLGVDDRGRIFVADTIRRRICVFEPVDSEEVEG